MRHASIEENGRGYLLHSDKIRWYFDHYFQGGEDRKAVSPLHMNFTPDLPATLLVTAAYDPLLDEGLAYLKRLAEAGITNQHRHCDDQMHAFLNMEDLTVAGYREFYRCAGDLFRTTGS